MRFSSARRIRQWDLVDCRTFGDGGVFHPCAASSTARYLVCAVVCSGYDQDVVICGARRGFAIDSSPLVLPAAFVGHLIGQRMHERLLTTDPVQFYRYLGSVLLGVSLLGIGRTLFS